MGTAFTSVLIALLALNGYAVLDAAFRSAARRRKWKTLVLGVLAAYVLAYGVARSTHTLVHAGAYYENGAIKYHEHRLEVDPVVGLVFPFGAKAIRIVFAPMMLAEVAAWEVLDPVSM